MLGKKKHKKYESKVTESFGPQAPVPLGRVQPLNEPVINIVIDEACLKKLESGGFNQEWLMSLANRYNFNKIEYLDKFKGFRCYTDGKMVDTITANDLAHLNSHARLTDKGMAFRKLDKNKQTIQIPWRQ